MRPPFAVAVAALCLAAASAASAQTKINIGIVTNPTFVHTRAATWFKECLDKQVPGKFDVVIHHSAVLGSETQVLQQIQLGTTQMSVSTTGPVEAFVPEIKALEMPFLFPSYEAADKVLDGPIGQDLRRRFEPVMHDTGYVGTMEAAVLLVEIREGNPAARREHVVHACDQACNVVVVVKGHAAEDEVEGPRRHPLR
jgi:TRAP-type C4-dicarboxylate transport system substrate-binding protein